MEHLAWKRNLYGKCSGLIFFLYLGICLKDALVAMRETRMERGLCPSPGRAGVARHWGMFRERTCFWLCSHSQLPFPRVGCLGGVGAHKGWQSLWMVQSNARSSTNASQPQVMTLERWQPWQPICTCTFSNNGVSSVKTEETGKLKKG
jgi:hypothetical protein